MTTVFERIQRFNQGRIPELVKLKYQTMGSNAFTFFRGTCHLFYEDWSAGIELNTAPTVWLCGDLHLENFGSYKGENRLVYFDINDFDEAVLAPCTWDLARFLTSILVGARTLSVDDEQATILCNSFLKSYINALGDRARTVERETAEGMVKDLLISVKQRDRKDFIHERTQETATDKRKLRIDNKRTQPVTKAERAKVTTILEEWASLQPNPKFFKIIDVAHRIAGIGSLGVERYVILIEGKGSPNHNYLLDLKAEFTSSLQPYLKQSQPNWSNQAQRVVTIQNRVQGTPPALLAALEFEGQAYVLRELQPSEDRVQLNQWNGKLRRLDKVIDTMGELVAWGQLRSGGRQGSAIADQMIEFAANTQWRQALLDYARSYSAQVEKDYLAFCAAL